jgi:hypothetical protein
MANVTQRMKALLRESGEYGTSTILPDDGEWNPVLGSSLADEIVKAAVVAAHSKLPEDLHDATQALKSIFKTLGNQPASIMRELKKMGRTSKAKTFLAAVKKEL